MPQPKGYTRTQIILHWAVFLLVGFQLLFGDSMSHIFRAVMREGAAPTAAAFVHIVIGVAVVVLVAWRMAIKAKRGAPPLPDDEPEILKLAANLMHLALYAVVILMVVSGGVAWFAQIRWAADAHEVMKALLIVLILAHVAGALYQQFVLKSDVMTRMGKPEA